MSEITLIKYTCCFCKKEFKLPRKGFGEKQDLEFLDQAIYFFIPFYVWRICANYLESKVKENPKNWKLKEINRQA